MPTSSASSSASGGCLRALLRLPLIVLLALSTSWSLFETFLVTLNARPTTTALAAEAGTELLTPHLTDQAFVKADYQDVQNQASAQPTGSVYFPFLRSAIPANEIAGKSTTDTLRVVYLHMAGAYYDQSGFDGIFGLTPPQLKQYDPQISQVCPKVASLDDTAMLPPGLDLSFILTALSGQSDSAQSGTGGQANSGNSGSGSGQTDSAQTQQQAQQLVKLARIVCASIQRGNGLSSADLSAIISVASSTTSSNGSNSSSGSSNGASTVPQLPDLAHNPLLGAIGLSVPLSANAEGATTDRQHLAFALSALLALLLVLLSRGWGRLVHVAVGVLLGGATGMGVLVAVTQVWSHFQAQLQPYTALLHAVESAFTPPYLAASIAGGLGILTAIGGTVAAKVVAARAGPATGASGSALADDAASVAAGPDDVTVPDLAKLGFVPSAVAATSPDSTVGPVRMPPAAELGEEPIGPRAIMADSPSSPAPGTRGLAPVRTSGSWDEPSATDSVSHGSIGLDSPTFNDASTHSAGNANPPAPSGGA